MTHVFHRHCHSKLPTAASGNGVYITDTENNTYLDACGGAAVSSLGHSDPRVREAIIEQINQLAYAHTSFFTTPAAEQLATKIATTAPGNLGHVYFVSGGSEAIESALKLARQYFIERGQPERTQFISRRQSYHGNTLGALAVGGNLWRREPFEPLLISTPTIAPCYAYRDQQPGESEFDYGQRVANELETTILEYGAETIIGFIAEPIVGATAGAVAPVDGYFKRVREICDQYGILLILDEVMCGSGRSGTWFAHEQEGITADIVAIAKGLGAGYQPIGAMVCSDEIFDTISNGSGYFQHGHTYLAHAAAVAGALAVFDAIEQDKLLDQVKVRGEQLQQRLTERFSENPYIGDIRGRGLFRGIELVADKANKTPLPPATQMHKHIKQAAMDNGLMIYPMAGTIDGKQGHHILLAPPFIISESQLDELVDKLDKALIQAFTENTIPLAANG